MAFTLQVELLDGVYGGASLPPDEPIPAWFDGPGLTNLTRADDELSILCRVERIPDDVEHTTDWRALKVSTRFAFDASGLLDAVVHPLTKAGLAPYVVSTFMREYLLVRGRELDKALMVLKEGGHDVTLPDATH